MTNHSAPARSLFVAFFLFAIAPSLFTAQQAKAQWATFDVTNAIAMGKQFLQLKRQIETARDQYDSMQQDLQEFEDMSDWNASEWIDQVEGAQDQLDAMSYVMADIDEQMGEVFGTEAYEDYVEDHSEQLERTLSTMRTAVNAMRSHRLQIEDGIDKVQELKDNNQDADGNLKALQAQTNVAIYQIENLQMMREQIATLTNAISVQNSQRLSERIKQEKTARSTNQSMVEVDRPELRTRP